MHIHTLHGISRCLWAETLAVCCQTVNGLRGKHYKRLHCREKDRLRQEWAREREVWVCAEALNVFPSRNYACTHTVYMQKREVNHVCVCVLYYIYNIWLQVCEPAVLSVSWAFQEILMLAGASDDRLDEGVLTTLPPYWIMTMFWCTKRP